MTYAPIENTDLHGHPHRLIRVLVLCWTPWVFMRAAKKLIRLGGRPGHWRKKVLDIGSWVRGVEGCKLDYCRATGRPQATFKIIRGGPCCLPPVPTPMQANFSLSTITGKKFPGSTMRNLSARDDHKNINITGILLFHRENFFIRIFSITCFRKVIRTLGCSVCIFYSSYVSIRSKFAAYQGSILFHA